MKTLFTLLLGAVLLSSSVAAQTNGYNLFDPNDCDAQGWLWFDTQAKIDKYIGQANNTIGAYDPAGKPIQMVSTDYTIQVPDPDGFPGDMINVPILTVASADSIGAAKDPVSTTDPDGQVYDAFPIGGPGALQGAIVLPRASAAGSTNGGGLLIKLPPIVAYELLISGTRYMMVNITGTKTIEERFPAYYQIKGYSVFKKLKKTGGHLNYNIGEEKNEGTGNAVKSSDVQCVLLRNTMTVPLYIHGIRLFTVENHSTGADRVLENRFVATYRNGRVECNTDQAALTLFDLAGKPIARGHGRYLPVPRLTSGVYLLRVAADGHTQTTKIVVK